MPSEIICWRSSYVRPTNSPPLPPGHRPCTPESTSRWMWCRVAGISMPSSDMTVTVGAKTPPIINLPPFGCGVLAPRQRKSRDNRWVANVLLQRPAPAQNIDNVLDCDCVDVLAGLHRPGRHMRRQDHVLHVG